MPTIKDTCVEIAEALATAEEDASPENLTALHTALWDGIVEHAEELGLTGDDLDEISVAGQGGAARAGEPKPR